MSIDVKSINRVQVVGTLKEMNLEKITKEVSLGDKKVTCQQFAKKEFKNPMFIVEVNGNDIGIDFFPIAEKKLENGSVVDNPRFKAMETVYSTYVPKSRDAENATRVKVDGSMRANEYVDKNTFDFKSFPSLNGFQITSTNVPAEDIADCEISGVIKNIYKEVRGDNEEETGRLKVDFLYVENYGDGGIYPTTFVVESDLASDFESFYEAGQSVKLYYEILVKQIGQKKATTGGFGRRESHIVSGFSVTEYSVFRGDEPFEEENEYFISIDKVKELLEERDIMIENKIKEAKSGGTVASTTVKKTPFGSADKPATKAEKKNPFI